MTPCRNQTDMDAPDAAFAARWHAAVRNLRLRTECVQATADELPMHIELTGHALHPDPAAALRRHQIAFGDYMTALACVQALLQEHDIGLP